MTNSGSKFADGDGVAIFDIEEYLNSLVRRSNAAPLEDFSGLSPDQMHHLFYYPFGKGSPIFLREDISDETLSSIPFFRLVEELIKIVGREHFIKLTPKGALPRKILHELYGFGFLREEFIEKGYVKLMREADSVVLTTLPIVARLGGLISKKYGSSYSPIEAGSLPMAMAGKKWLDSFWKRLQANSTGDIMTVIRYPVPASWDGHTPSSFF